MATKPGVPSRDPDAPYMPRIIPGTLPGGIPASPSIVNRNDSSGIPDKIWKICQDALTADGRLTERTVIRASFAVGQVTNLVLGIAHGEYEVKPGGTYEMPDYEALNGRLPVPQGHGSSGNGSHVPGTPNTPVPTPDAGTIPRNALDIAIAVRSHYPTPLNEFSPARLSFLRELARALGPDAGLLSKTTGTNNNGYAVDIICFKNGDHFDVVNGATTQAQWSYVGKVDPSRWRAP